jgi:alkaline phosphatase D
VTRDAAKLSRRQFCIAATGLVTSTATGGCAAAPAISHSASRPRITHGVQAGDLSPTGGVIWSRADRPAQLHVEIATTESFADPIRLPPVLASADTGLAARVSLPALPRGQRLFYRARFVSPTDARAWSEPVTGSLATLKDHDAPVRFVWGGDTAGQGWGIDPARGGMQTYAAMLAVQPDFFIHSGDTIYADGPVPPQIALPDGSFWRNRVTDGVERVAQTLDEFRGRHRYNLTDQHLRAFNAAVPGYYHWDDHEVLNNHSPSTDLAADPRYSDVTLGQLQQRALRAFREMLPVDPSTHSSDGTYRSVRINDQLELFSLDLRSYRAANRPAADDRNDYPLLGETQFRWLRRALRQSTARWKIIACSQPVGVAIADDFRTGEGMEGIASGTPGSPEYREAELARLLSDLKAGGVRNLLWLTADVHYAAAHHYHPARAAFADFDPFWEFVAGPLHAGTFPAGPLDSTFGPRAEFYAGPLPGEGVNLPPSANRQYFGMVELDGRSGALSVQLIDRTGTRLYERTLVPDAPGR